jgi:hypothetical protein
MDKHACEEVGLWRSRPLDKYVGHVENMSVEIRPVEE